MSHDLGLLALAIYRGLRHGGWHPIEYKHNRAMTEKWYATLAQAAAEAVTAAEPYDHPESKCNRCGGPNVSWSAPSPLWNEVMRGGDINGPWQYGEVICPTCFAVLAEAAGVVECGTWRFTGHSKVPLTTVTPSGRVWNEATQLWDEPAESPAPDSLESSPARPRHREGPAADRPLPVCDDPTPWEHWHGAKYCDNRDCSPRLPTSSGERMSTNDDDDAVKAELGECLYAGDHEDVGGVCIHCGAEFHPPEDVGDGVMTSRPGEDI